MVFYDPTGSGTTGSFYGYDGQNFVQFASGATARAHSDDVVNLTLTTSVPGSKFMISVKDKDGNDPSSGSPVTISFRNSGVSSGSFVIRNITSALSLDINNGSTLGMSSGVPAYLYVYALDNSGSVELAIANGLVDEGTLHSSTSEGGGAATSAGVLYSSVARASKAVRLVGRILISEATAGNWSTNASEVAVLPFSTSQYLESKNSTISTWTSGATVWADVTSLTLPIGEWDLTGFIVPHNNGTVTGGDFNFGISTNSGNTSGGMTYGDNESTVWNSGNVNFNTSLVIPSYRVIATSPTTYYLKLMYDQASSSNIQIIGYRLSARRVR